MNIITHDLNYDYFTAHVDSQCLACLGYTILSISYIFRSKKGKKARALAFGLPNQSMSKSFEANQSLPAPKVRKIQKSKDQMVALVKSEHSISYSSINSTPRGSFLDNSAFSGITGLNIGASYNHNSGLDVIDESYSQKNSDQEKFNHGIMNPNKIVLSLDENNKVRTFFNEINRSRP